MHGKTTIKTIQSTCNCRIGMQPRNSKEVAEFYNEVSKSVRKTFYTTSRLKAGDTSWRWGKASCLRTGSSCGFSGARQLDDGRHKRRGIAWLAVQIPIHKKGLWQWNWCALVYQKGMLCPCKQTDFTVTFCSLQTWRGACGGVVVTTPRYKTAGRGFDSQWCHRNFSVT